MAGKADSLRTERGKELLHNVKDVISSNFSAAYFTQRPRKKKAKQNMEYNSLVI